MSNITRIKTSCGGKGGQTLKNEIHFEYKFKKNYNGLKAMT
jgi:hypothetical protein